MTLPYWTVLYCLIGQGGSGDPGDLGDPGDPGDPGGQDDKPR